MIRRVKLILARRHVSKGDSARDDRQWVHARVQYQRALAYAPWMSHIWVQLGHARKESGQLEAAEAAYRKALQQEPNKADTYLQLGHLFKIRGRFEDAVEMYSRAAGIEPKDRDAVSELKTAGYASDGHQRLGIRLEGPARCHVFNGTIDVHASAIPELVTASEVVRLVADGQLSLTFALHLDHSGNDAVMSGLCAIGLGVGGTLKCHVAIPINLFENSRLGLLLLQLRYVAVPDSDAIVTEPLRLAISPRSPDLGSLFLDLTRGKAVPIV